MTAGFHHESAKIYQFPATARRNSFAKLSENGQSTVISFPEKVHYDVVDTCWYHQDAVTSESKAPN